MNEILMEFSVSHFQDSHFSLLSLTACLSSISHVSTVLLQPPHALELQAPAQPGTVLCPKRGAGTWESRCENAEEILQPPAAPLPCEPMLKC